MPYYDHPDFVDEAGREYGRWTVLRLSAELDSQGDHLWVCLCDPARGGCGRERDLRGGLLRAGKTRGCRSCHTRDMHRAGVLRRPVPNKHRKKTD